MCMLGIVYSICESMPVCQSLCQETFYIAIFNPHCFYSLTLSYKPTQHAIYSTVWMSGKSWDFCRDFKIASGRHLAYNSANWSKLPKFNYVLGVHLIQKPNWNTLPMLYYSGVFVSKRFAFTLIKGRYLDLVQRNVSGYAKFLGC